MQFTVKSFSLLKCQKRKFLYMHLHFFCCCCAWVSCKIKCISAPTLCTQLILILFSFIASMTCIFYSCTDIAMNSSFLLFFFFIFSCTDNQYQGMRLNEHNFLMSMRGICVENLGTAREILKHGVGLIW